MDKISVIIPTYNRAHLITRAIDSVREQTYDNLEIIVVDDASTDNTEAVVTCLGDHRIIYKKLAENGGAAHARNVGVECAGGELIAFLDSDDCWHPKKLEKQMVYWRGHPEFSMVYCPFRVHLKTGSEQFPVKEMGILEGRLFSALLVRNSIGTPTMLLSKESFLAVGGFDTSLRSLEDWDFVLRFSREYCIGYLDEVLVDVYSAGTDRISNNTGAFYEGRLKMLALYREQLMKDGHFDEALLKVFEKAQKDGILEQVQQMFMLMLSKEGI